LVGAGVNPFQFLPIELVDSTNVWSSMLVDKMNSPNYYSVYPPVHQFIFGIASSLFPADVKGAVIIMRLFIIAADVGIIWIGMKLLNMFGLPKRRILWYALNPLVIIELSGNLHFEGVMLFFLLLFIYFLVKEELRKSAFVFALAISTKLIPVIFLPLVFNYLGFKKGLRFSFTTALVVVFSFVPFINWEMIHHLSSSLDLYFQNFEFNASIYYLVSAIYRKVVGYNLIAVVGPSLAFVALLFILLISWRKRVEEVSSLIRGMLLVITTYYLFATIVHPWYIISLVLLSCFTTFRYPVLWSFTIMLSYFAYREIQVQESIFLLLLEYLPVIVFLVVELRKDSRAVVNWTV
jgi:hypothetical protein